MKLTLPVTKQDADVRDFVPHGVFARFQAAAMKGVKIDLRAGTATKEELLREFGADEMRKVDDLPAAEHEARLKELRQEYARRRTDVSGVTMQDAEESNMILVEGMVVSLGGQKPVREDIEGLPEADYQVLLQHVLTLANDPLGRPPEPTPGA